MTTVKKKTRKSLRTIPADRSRSSHPVDRLRMNGRRVQMTIGDRLTAATRNPTIEGPSALILDIWDGDRRVLRSGTLAKQIMASDTTLTLDGLTYVITRQSMQGDTLEVRAESSVVAHAREAGKGKAVREKRSDITRADFYARGLRSTGATVIVLDEFVEQSIAKETRKATGRSTGSSRSQTLTGDLTVKGVKATAEQRRVMAQVMAAANSVPSATPRAVLALVQAIIVECEFRNEQGSGADSISYGVIQNIPGESVGINGTFTKAQALDVAYSVKSALRPPGPTSKGGLIKLARENPSWSPGKVAAVAINGGGDPAYSQKCDSHKAEAEKIIKAGGGISGGSTSTTVDQTYWFEKKKNEGWWGAARRAFDEVQWRLFEREGVIIIATDAALIRAQATLEFDATSDWVEDGVDFEQLRGADVAEASCNLRAARYQVDPGEVARILGQSQTDEDWIIYSAVVSLLDDPWVQVRFTQPRAALDEPTAATTTVKTGGDDSDLRAACKSFDTAGNTLRAGPRHSSYSANGHGQKCKDMDPKKGGDCSSSVSWALWKSGFLPHDALVRVSDGFLTFGEAGRGAEFTVWVRHSEPQHVFILGDGWRFDTGGPGGGSGARLYTGAQATRDTRGCVPRHVSGH